MFVSISTNLYFLLHMFPFCVNSGTMNKFYVVSILKMFEDRFRAKHIFGSNHPGGDTIACYTGLALNRTHTHTLNSS